MIASAFEARFVVRLFVDFGPCWRSDLETVYDKNHAKMRLEKVMNKSLKMQPTGLLQRLGGRIAAETSGDMGKRRFGLQNDGFTLVFYCVGCWFWY